MAATQASAAWSWEPAREATAAAATAPRATHPPMDHRRVAPPARASAAMRWPSASIARAICAPIV